MNFSSSFPSALRLTVLAGVLLLGTLSTSAAQADSIGVNLIGGGVTLAATTSAGVVPQINFNNNNGTLGTTRPLTDDRGAQTTATVTLSAGFEAAFDTMGFQPMGGDERLNSGGIASARNTPSTITINSIPYGTYDLYIYNLALSGVTQQTTLGSTSYFSASPNPIAAGYVDHNAATPYIYTRATSTTAGVFTPNANYVLFSGLSGNSQTFTVTGLSNSSGIQGFQVVATPEPSTYAMMFLGVGALGLMTWMRKRSANSEADLGAI